MDPKTCVSPSGNFIYGIHTPDFTVKNLSGACQVDMLGRDEEGAFVDNRANFPLGSIEAHQGDPVFEIPNAFPFRGTTYITKSWADRKAADRGRIHLPPPKEMSVSRYIEKWAATEEDRDPSLEKRLASMPEPLQLATAVNSTDPRDLVTLAHSCCRLVFDKKKSQPVGMAFKTAPDGKKRAIITNQAVFEAVANNPYLPDTYKKCMVLRPGIQGTSEIVGQWRDPTGRSHVYEYLRKNSYIPWGHYAANMAEDTIRYRVKDLTILDMQGMRYLYYQRSYVRMAAQLGLPLGSPDGALSVDQLEALRKKISDRFSTGQVLPDLFFNRTLWGWNFGFDYAPSKYRLHASHQQVHQQYALLPKQFATQGGLGSHDGQMTPYGLGDLVEAFIRSYQHRTSHSFFECYLRAIQSNQRMDENHAGPTDLVVVEDDHVMLFVPKAQTSQWELQLMVKAPVGNIIETDSATRQAVDRAIWVAIRTLGAMGARMITGIEISKRFDAPTLDQHLIYSFLPRLPESPGAFSETQLRWINGHYPEDFATVCRDHLPD